MSIALVDVFGVYITVSPGAYRADRQRSAFSGANGLTDMMLGLRGYPIIVTGLLYGSGANYAAKRQNILSQIQAIESYFWDAEETYTFFSDTYYNVVFDKLDFPGQGNPQKMFNWTSEGYLFTAFKAFLTSLA